MDYRRIYSEFITDRKAKPKPQGYTERHHIVPRSLGGGDKPENLIDLTAREHYFAHCCLAKIYGGKMWAALMAVANMAKSEASWRYFCSRRMVEAAREKAAKRRSDHMKQLWASGQFKRNRVYEAWTDERRAAHRQKALGRKSSPQAISRSIASRAAKAKVFDFVGPDGVGFSGTSKAFRLHSGLSQSMVSYLTRGKIITAKGWSLKGKDRRAAFGRDPEVRRFLHKDGNEFVGTTYELRVAYPHLDCGSVSKLVNGKLGSVNGWKIAPVTALSV